MITDYYCFLFPSELVRILRLKEMLEKETVIYLKDFVSKKRKQDASKVGKTDDFQTGNYVHTDEKRDRQWEPRADKPATTDC